MRQPSAMPLPRWSLAAASALHAALLASAAVALPWRAWTMFAWATGTLALVHGLVGVLALVRSARLLVAWRAQAALSVAWLAYVGWGLLSSAWYVRSLYQGMGQAVGWGLVAVFLLLVSFTLPMAAWGFAATGGIGRKRTHAAGAALIALAAIVQLWRLDGLARGDGVEPDVEQAVAHELSAQLDVTQLARARDLAVTLATRAPADCAEPATATLTLVATYITTKGARSAAATHCAQADDAAALVNSLVSTLAREARRAPVKLDLITNWAPLDDREPVVHLALRPGIDGVCAALRCLMPWQLVMMDSFNRHTPIDSVPDARFGASIAELRKQLGEPSAPLFRIATAGWVASGDGVVPYGRSADVALDADTLRQGAAAAEEYVLRSQLPDGRFKYMIDPLSGTLTMGDFSIARQAGTTLVICELGRESRQVSRVVARSLDMLAGLHEPLGDELAIMPFRIGDDEPTARIGPTALTLAALLRCRSRAGNGHDALIGKLARSVLLLQRPDGGFHHHIDKAARTASAQPLSTFVDGQLVLALSLLEAVASESRAFPERETVHAAVERAMQYFASDYWNGFVRELFFLEENWHCLAAAAALPTHRHDGYERFCIDYVTFKSRVVQDEGDVHTDFVGGYGVGNVVPPHNTATAGFGEALAAMLAVKRARGMDTRADEQNMVAVLGFLLKNQWTAARCFACSTRERVHGGFSEHMASPRIRIDYVQHAWAALGHGGQALGML